MTTLQIIGLVVVGTIAGLAGRYVWDFTGPWRGKGCARCAELEKEVAKTRALLFECSTLLSQVMLTLLDELDS